LLAAAEVLAIRALDLVGDEAGVRGFACLGDDPHAVGSLDADGARVGDPFDRDPA
jgi:hypothetical protein